MKRENWLYPLIAVLVTLGGFFFLVPSKAGITCSLPFNLTNGTTADASQVMANYNALTACMLNNLAASGANNDVTSLSGLTTPLSPAQGGTVNYVGATASGTNTIVVASTTPSNFTLTAGNTLSFISSAVGNTGAATLNVNGTGAKAILRAIPNGSITASLVGGEIPAGAFVQVLYTGGAYMLTFNYAPGTPGTVFDYAGTSCPAGSLLANGGSFVTTNFPDLNAVLGSTWGAPGLLPDFRGRAAFGADSGGSGRITIAGGNFDGTIVGNGGGQQSNVVNKVNLAAFPLPVTDPGHVHHTTADNTAFAQVGGSGINTIVANTSVGQPQALSSTLETTGITVASGGSSIPLPTLSNAAIVLKCVKA
jgi:hypothetical protein